MKFSFSSKKRKSAKALKKLASMGVLINPPVKPGTYLWQNGKGDIFNDIPRLREEIRKFARANDTLAAVLRLTSMFASKGPEIKCEDPQNEEILQQIFKPSDMEAFFTDFFKEFLISGAAASVAKWDAETRSFTEEQIIEGSDFRVREGDDYGDVSVELFRPSRQGSDFNYSNVDIQGAPNGLNQSHGEAVPEDEVVWCIHKDRPSDTEGYPFFAPALSALYQKESLDGALNQELNQLAKPLIIATVAGIGDDVASPETLDYIKELLTQVQMADLRELVLPSQVDVHNAFSGVQVQDLSKYYEWATQAILRVPGMSRTLLDGSQSGPYASASINRDVYSSFIGSLRNVIVKAYQKRIDTAVKALDLRMMRTNEEGERHIMFVDEFGNLTFDPTDAPAYEEASLSFENDILKDPNQELNTLNTLMRMDVPISKQTIVSASGLNIDLASQMRQIAEEDKLKEQLNISDEQLPMDNNPAQTKDIDEARDDYTDKKPIGDGASKQDF